MELKALATAAKSDCEVDDKEEEERGGGEEEELRAGLEAIEIELWL